VSGNTGGRNRKEKGAHNEHIAADFLSANGMRILKKNHITPFGEIDIVARDGEYTAFVEVKSREFSAYGTPLYAIDRKKRAHIIKNSLYYMKTHGLEDTPCRLDVVGITFDGNGMVMCIEHYKNAIEAW
jgi:putative endonuclease